MTYTITIQLDDKEIQSDSARTIVSYLREVLETMGYSYQIDCYKDGMRVMMSLESPPAEDSSPQ